MQTLILAGRIDIDLVGRLELYEHNEIGDDRPDDGGARGVVHLEKVLGHDRPRGGETVDQDVQSEVRVVVEVPVEPNFKILEVLAHVFVEVVGQLPHGLK